MPRGLKVGNEYASILGRDFTFIPKSVFAAIAFSFAMRFSDDDRNKARALLFQNGKR